MLKFFIDNFRIKSFNVYSRVHFARGLNIFANTSLIINSKELDIGFRMIDMPLGILLATFGFDSLFIYAHMHRI